jgi:NADH pyrophosphatase NudC (nudix superfamily)
MLVIDKERDCVILGRQSRFVARMWSCLAGFMEVGLSFLLVPLPFDLSLFLMF